MGTPALFDSILKKHLGIHAAWLPVTNTFELGDYGLVSDGVLVKIGNIRSFGTSWQETDGPESRLDFASEGTRVTRTVGGAELNALPDQDLDAKVTIEFANASSFLIKANLAVREMQDIADVARRLRDHDDWESRYRVVSRTYVGGRCTVLSSTGAQSKIELTGKANALKQLELGAASMDVEIASSEKIGLQIVGKTGVVGLSLFKLGWLTGRPKLLGAPQQLDDDGVTLETEANWAGLDDDV